MTPVGLAMREARKRRAISGPRQLAKRIYPILIVDEPALGTPGINTYLSRRFRALVGANRGIQRLAVVTLDELETIVPHIAAGDLLWDELVDARTEGEDVSAKPVLTTFYEIGVRKRFRSRSNQVLNPARRHVADLLREKYRHLK